MCIYTLLAIYGATHTNHSVLVILCYAKERTHFRLFNNIKKTIKTLSRLLKDYVSVYRRANSA